MGGFTVQKQPFGKPHIHDHYDCIPLTNPITVAVSKVQGNIVDGDVSGLIGLAFTGIASSQATPFWLTLAQNNLLTAPEMSFFLTRFDNVQNAQENEPGGVFTLGGTNTTLYSGEIEFNSMPSPNPQTFWLLSLSGLSCRLCS